MALPKAHGTNNGFGGKMIGQTVPMMNKPMAKTQPGRPGFKSQGSLVGHVAGVPGTGGTPAEKTMRNAPFRRPQDAPASRNVMPGSRIVHDYSPKKKI